MLNIRGVLLAALLLLLLIGGSYLPNQPLFKGFALAGVPVWCAAFMIVLMRVSMSERFLCSRWIRFFKSISYEMYLSQGIGFLILDKVSGWNPVVFVFCLLVIDIALSVVFSRINKLVMG